ncbi:MAG: DUF4911 domain-containing protein [Proteobacteria bacterium]|nr:DUF4911 domain-containing protein [Pseudomonadota bacterium]MBU1709510.1 DUF4911 domain-containing protein [Pseudomonadota bacterium]
MPLRIAPERIYFLRFILEGYDGLAILSTLDQHAGVVEIRFPESASQVLFGLLEDIAPTLFNQSRNPNL